MLEIAREISGAKLLILQQFRPVGCLDPAFERVKPYPPAEVEQMAEAARRFVKECRVLK